MKIAYCLQPGGEKKKSKIVRSLLYDSEDRTKSLNFLFSKRGCVTLAIQFIGEKIVTDVGENTSKLFPGKWTKNWLPLLFRKYF